MGSWFEDCWNNRIKSSWKLAFFSAFGIGVLVHLFKLVNVLPFWDSLMNHYSSQDMIASGRWLLSTACMFGSKFDLPWINGILSLLFIGLTAAVISELFRMESPTLIILCSGLLVTFPGVTTTLEYSYTADGYMLAMLMSAFAAYLTRMEKMRKGCWKRLLLGGALICCSCAIYQAYVSFAFAFAVGEAILELLEGKCSAKRILCWIGIQLLVFGGALALYYGIWKGLMALRGMEATTYQGISSIGTNGIRHIAYAVINVLIDTAAYVLRWNIFEHGLSLYAILNVLVLLVFGAGVVCALSSGKTYKAPSVVCLLIVLVLSLPFGCFLWHFASPGVHYHPVMTQSLCILPILTAVLFDRFCKGRKADAVAILLAMVICSNSVSANIFYDQMHLRYERDYAEAVELNTRIHLLDDGNVRYIAFCGDPVVSTPDMDALRAQGGCWLPQVDLTSYHFLLLYTDFELQYYRNTGEAYPVVENYLEYPVPRDYEFRFPLLPAEEMEAIKRSDEVMNMPLWPSEGSVLRIEDVIVVKFS